MSDADTFRNRFKKRISEEKIADPLDEFSVIVARARSLMAAGLPDHDIISELEITQDYLMKVKSAIYESESGYILNQTPIEAFISYRFKMEKVCDDLDYVHEGARNARQFTAAMGALKAKASIIDKVMDRGQDMGIIPRAAIKVSHEIALTHLSDEQLIDKMKTLTIKNTELVGKYGEEDMTSVIVPDLYDIE